MQPQQIRIESLRAIARKAKRDGDSAALSVALVRHATSVTDATWKDSIQEALADFEELSIGLQMACVAIDYRATGNEHELLRLPLELRALLKEHMHERSGSN